MSTLNKLGLAALLLAIAIDSIPATIPADGWAVTVSLCVIAALWLMWPERKGIK